MEKLESYTIIALFAVIGILLLFKQCGTPRTSTHYIKGEDSVVYDTVKVPYEVIKFKTKLYPKWDTVEKNTTIYDGSLCEFKRIYKDTVSNDTVDIFVNTKTIGLIESQQVSYALKLPKIEKTVYRTDTLIKPNKWDLYIGGEVGGNKTTFNVSPFVGIRIKDVSYQYRYGIFDKTHNIGIAYKIFKSKK